MRIAVTAAGTTLRSPMDIRFGRAPVILIYDTETRDTEVIDNRSSDAMTHGAGLQTVQRMVSHTVDTVITTDCGPKAFEALKKSGITVYHTDAPTAFEALALYQHGFLKPMVLTQ